MSGSFSHIAEGKTRFLITWYEAGKEPGEGGRSRTFQSRHRALNRRSRGSSIVCPLMAVLEGMWYDHIIDQIKEDGN